TVDPSGGTSYVTGLERDAQLAELVRTPAIVDAARARLRHEPALLNLRLRAPKPGAGAQTLHRDAPGVLNDGTWQSVTVIVTLCDFTSDNGTLRVVPGSHVDRFDGFVARSPQTRHPRQLAVTAPAGSAIVFSGGMLHSGTRNDSTSPRPGLQALFV